MGLDDLHDDFYEKTSRLKVRFDGGVLFIDYQRSRKIADDTATIIVAESPEDRKVNTSVRVKSYHLKNKVFLVTPVTDSETLVVYTAGDVVKYYRHTDPSTHPLTRLLTIKSKTIPFLTKRGIHLLYACAVVNPYKIKVVRTDLIVGTDFAKQKIFPSFLEVPSARNILKKHALYFDFIPLKDLLKGEPTINERIGVALHIDEDRLPAYHNLTKGSRRTQIKGKKWFYAPIARTRRDGYSVSIRRNGNAGLSLVRRQLEDIEKTTKFRFYESLLVSFVLYHCAHLVRKLSKQIINIYYEKNANQAEEGTIDLFRKARNESVTQNYFIINEWSKDFDSIKDEPGVVQNFTLKSYWLLYRANNYIASETAAHLNVLRSDNKYVRMAAYSQKFVFLQHGVTYMKAQDKSTSFKRHRECEPDFMIVNSKKERDIVSDMLSIEEERLLNTGMLIFDNIEYDHISQVSPNIVTIMLTWKPYEEHLKDATKSTYYKTVVKLYDMLKPLVGKENIRIVIHPKFKDHMTKTDMNKSIWQGSISDVLTETKLLITDYSSVCYNVFYQGGGVIYYQPDLERYELENGKLIPMDNEYTGHRVFNEADIKKLLHKNIINNKIDLSKFRTKEHIANYQTINEYHDGKSGERIYKELNKLGIL